MAVFFCFVVRLLPWCVGHLIMWHAAYRFSVLIFQCAASSVPLPTSSLGVLKSCQTRLLIVLELCEGCCFKTVRLFMLCVCAPIFWKTFPGFLGSVCFTTIPRTSNIISEWFQKLSSLCVSPQQTKNIQIIYLYIFRTYMGPGLWRVLSKHLINGWDFSWSRDKGMWTSSH